MKPWKVAIFALFMCLAGNQLRASDAGSMIEKGVELHDAGDYQGAIRSFRSALELEPANTVALYELANTYLATGDFNSCIEAAKAGLEHPSDLDPLLHMAAGSCYSSAGKTRKALRSFRAGLDLAPNEARLHFNIAVTLFNSEDGEDAVEHLQKAVASEPSYASPYYFLGEIYRDEGKRVQSLYYFARFFTLEPNTARSASAATNAFGLLFSGIDVKSKSEVEVTVPHLEDDDRFSALELSLSIAGVSVHTDEGAALPSEAHRTVSALQTFFQITLEMNDPEDRDLRGTVVWNQAIAPLLRLHERELSEALGFVMATRAGVEGGQAWVDAHPESVKKLEAALGEAGS